MNFLKNFLLSFNDYKKIKKIKNSIIFYCETKRDWQHLEPLYEELKNLEELTSIIVTSDIDDPLLNLNTAFFIGNGAMRTVFFKTLDAKAVIMTLPDLDNYYIKRSNKI